METSLSCLYEHSDLDSQAAQMDSWFLVQKLEFLQPAANLFCVGSGGVNDTLDKTIQGFFILPTPS